MSTHVLRLWGLGSLVAGATGLALAVDASPPRASDRTEIEVRGPDATAGRPAALAGAVGRTPVRPGEAPPHAGLESRATAPAAAADTERAHLAAFLALAAEDSAALEASWRDVLRGEGPSYRKVALLRALLEARSRVLAEACALAIDELPIESDARGVSLPEFAVRLLGENASSRPELRTVLHDVAFEPGRARDPGLRTRAARALLAASDAEGLGRAARALRADPDPDVLRVVASALTDGTIEPSLSYLFAGLALPPEPAEVHE